MISPVARATGYREMLSHQWLTEDQSRQLPADKLAHAGQEVGDIVLYLLLLCSELGLDMDQVVRAKLADSERRFAHD